MHKYSIGLCLWNVSHVGKHKWVNPQEWSCALSIMLCFHIAAIWWCWQQNSGSVRTLLSPGTNHSWHTLTVRPVNLTGKSVVLSSSSLAITTIHYILHYRLSPSSSITYIVYMLNIISENHENISVFLIIFPNWNCPGNWIPVSYEDLFILHDQYNTSVADDLGMQGATGHQQPWYWPTSPRIFRLLNWSTVYTFFFSFFFR